MTANTVYITTSKCCSRRESCGFIDAWNQQAKGRKSFSKRCAVLLLFLIASRWLPNYMLFFVFLSRLDFFCSSRSVHIYPCLCINRRWSGHPTPDLPRILLIQSYAPQIRKSLSQSVSQSYLVICSPLVRLSSRHDRVDVQYLHDSGLEKIAGRITISLWPLTGKIDQKSRRDFFF